MTDLLKKITRTHTSIYISVEILQELAKKAKALGVSRNLLIEAAITEGLAIIGKRSKKK